MSQGDDSFYSYSRTHSSHSLKLNSEYSLVVKTFNVLAITQHLVIHILSEVRYVKFKLGFHNTYNVCYVMSSKVHLNVYCGVYYAPVYCARVYCAGCIMGWIPDG